MSIVIPFAVFCPQTVEYWIFQQKGKAKINAERIRLLDSIGFEWDPQKVQWQAMYDKLCRFERQHGHAKVPKGYSEDTELANWVRNQRLEHRNWEQQKRSRMTPERFALLDKLGFVWSQSTTSARKKTKKSSDSNDESNECGEVHSQIPTERQADGEPVPSNNDDTTC